MHIHISFLLLFVFIATILAENKQIQIPITGCKEERIDGRLMFSCYRNIDGQRVQQGILVHNNNNYYCGQFEKTVPKGKGFLFLGNLTDPKIYCGDVVDGLADGYGANQYLSNKQFMIGRFSTGYNEGTAWVYIPSKNLSARVQYKKGLCQQAIFYDKKGYRMKTDEKTCLLPKKFSNK